MGRKRHKNASAFCAWARRMREEYSPVPCGTPPRMFLDYSKNRWCWVLYIGYKQVNVPRHLVVDRLVMNLFRG